MKFITCLLICNFILGCSIRQDFKAKNPLIYDQGCSSFPKHELTGRWNCESFDFFYNVSPSARTHPMMEAERFKLAFKGNYYNKFFESIYIDTKLSKMYMDSVQVQNILDKTTHVGAMLFPCKTCNRIALLQFRKNVYPFPYYSQFPMDKHAYEVSQDTLDSYLRTIYLSKTNGESGLYLQPIASRSSASNIEVSLPITIDAPQVLSILRSIKVMK